MRYAMELLMTYLTQFFLGGICDLKERGTSNIVSV